MSRYFYFDLSRYKTNWLCKQFGVVRGTINKWKHDQQIPEKYKNIAIKIITEHKFDKL